VTADVFHAMDTIILSYCEKSYSLNLWLDSVGFSAGQRLRYVD